MDGGTLKNRTDLRAALFEALETIRDDPGVACSDDAFEVLRKRLVLAAGYDEQLNVAFFAADEALNGRIFSESLGRHR